MRACEVAGVATNLPLLRGIVDHPHFAAGAVDTGFLGRHPELRAAAATPPREAAAAAVATVRAARDAAARDAAGEDRWSPWAGAGAWRLNGEARETMTLRAGDAVLALALWPGAGGAFRLDLPGGPVAVAPGEGDALWIDGVRRRVPVVRDGDRLWALADGTAWAFDVVDPLAPPAVAGGGGGSLAAPMPGRIVSVDCAPGEAVARGRVLVVLEAMKVQMRLAAPRDGTVAAVRVAPGDLVDDGAELVSFAAEG